VRWLLRGWRGDEKWQGVVEGVLVAARRGPGLVARLRQLGDATAARPEALQLPVVLGLLAPLSLLAIEPWDGPTLADAVGTPGEEAAGARVGRALAALAPLDKQRDAERELLGVHRRVAALEAARHPAAPRLADLARRLAAPIADAARRLSPAARGLHARHVLLLAGGRVACRSADDVALAARAASAGLLAGQLEATAVKACQADSPAARGLVASFCEVSGEPRETVSAFEALVLLRRAARRALAGDDEAATLLAARAAGLLEG
jgi:hypothetical protein